MSESVDKVIDSLLARDFMGKGFMFRPNQRETIKQCVDAFLNNYENVIIEAPTGSGKSIIAMWVSKIFEERNITGYILTSDLNLQKQYKIDFKAKCPSFKSISGIDNYTCSVNGEKTSLSPCHSLNLGPRTKQLGCYETCPYFTARRDAVNAKVTLLNYAYHLIQRNIAKHSLFERRNFIIYDEAHKIGDIIQNHFSVDISNKIIEDIELIKESGFESKSSKLDFDKLKENFNTIFTSEITKDLILALADIKTQLKKYHSINYTDYQKLLSERYPNLIDNIATKKNIHYSATERKVLRAINRVGETYGKIEEYLIDLKKTSWNNLVKCKTSKDKHVQFKTIDEANLVKTKLLSKSDFKVYMSATFGDIEKYIKLNGISGKTKIIRMDNNFNYDKSPIYLVNRYNMAFKHKGFNFKSQIEYIDDLLDKHSNERGLIHTGNFEFSRELLKHIKRNKHRLLIYENTEQKLKYLAKLRETKNGIIAGPSLIEGIDLYDDLSRFQIFMKVPYPNMGDELIKAKFDKTPGWYSWRTEVEFMQGLGRSIRSPEDYAVTYLMDSNFNYFLKKSNLPQVQHRLKYIY